MNRPIPRTDDIAAKLREENDELREENRQLRELLNPPATLPTRWKLTPLETRIVLCLSRGKGGALATEHVLGAMYGPGHEHGRDCLHVAVNKIRRKRDLHGLTVETNHGHGFSMPAESCAIVQAALTVAEASPENMRAGMRGEAPISATAAAA